MSGIKTVSMAAALIATALPAPAAPAEMRLFATCAGRLSAQMEHQWLLADPAADRTERQRAAMISLLEAAMAPGEERSALALRIEAKAAQAALLTRASFGRDWKASPASSERNNPSGLATAVSRSLQQVTV